MTSTTATTPASRMSLPAFLSFKVRHETALSDLRDYRRDSQEDAARIDPVLNAGTIEAMIEAAPGLIQYVPCSIFIDELYHALIAMRATR
jgi:hypothetical protein